MLTNKRSDFETTKYWEGNLKEAGFQEYFDSLTYYNNVPPAPDSGYGEPVLQNQVIGGHLVDLYLRTDEDKGNGATGKKWVTAYLNIKG